jgi:hypothetical protein
MLLGELRAIKKRLAMLSLSPVISKLFYAVLLSTLQQEQTTVDHLQSALFRGKSSYKRTMSTVNLVDRLIPGIARGLSRWMYKNNRFPWEPIDIELIAFGTGAAVFKVNWNNKDKVLRIYRKSLGKPYRGLVEMAAYYKNNYETVRSWYGSADGLVLPMEFMVLQGLPLIGPVAASLQPYIHGQRQDLFEDHSDDELLQLLAANREVREQFLVFARQTMRQWEEGKMCYDFVGRENLMLVKHGAHYRLRIADVGIFKFDAPMKDLPGKMAQIEQRMSRMAAIYELAKDY